MDFIPKDSSVFRSAVDALKEFLPQAQVRVNADGLRICGMDVSHVGFVDYFLSAKDCETLVVDGAGLVLGIHTAVLAKVLSNVGSGDKIRICKTKKADKNVKVCLHQKKRQFFVELGDLMRIPHRRMIYCGLYVGSTFRFRYRLSHRNYSNLIQCWERRKIQVHSIHFPKFGHFD